ncbi:MAG: glycoside hydrolase family 127 protein [Bacteroidales bacterium]|nr:glycoside hydrolase family 127 protein [Bacteroidales bacterium]
MKKTTTGCLLLLMSFQLAIGNRTMEEPIKTDNPREVIAFDVLPFGITQVKLLDGPFKHATELNIHSLLAYEPDRLLAKFRIEAGLEPKAEHYGGWEGETLAGHSLGHYLSGCALMYNTTGNQEFLDRVNYIVDELTACQEASGSGYLGAVPGAKKVFDEDMVNGEVRSQGFDLNGIWAPIYTQHKIMAGLLDAYMLCANEKALVAAEKFAGWMENYISKMTDANIQKMLHCEHGGINESLAELYAITGKKKYEDLSLKFYHKEILDPLSQGIDILPGKHANTQIPKIIGLARLYELSGDTEYKETAEFFWDRVVYHHSYVTGGHCDHEYFGPPDTLRNRLSESTTETCNVYNMLKLSRHLFEWHARAEVADFYERALFNHILASQHPSTGHVIYNLSLEMGGHKVYQDPAWFTCCVGTGMETHSKYPANIYYHNENELYVSQFIASELNWEEKQVVIKQVTQYPEEEGTQLTVHTKSPLEFTMKIRYPYWAVSGIKVKVNGKELRIKETPSSFIAIKRKWKNGDKVEVSFPFSLRTESMPDDPKRIAIFNGPVVLAGILGDTTDANAYDPMYVPVLITTADDLPSKLAAVSGEPGTFSMANVGRPRDVMLKPFYKTNDVRYTIYWDIFTEDKWKQAQEEYKAKIEEDKNIERQTIDFFQPGEMQPERDHNFQEHNSWVDEHKGRKYREAHNGWMSCEMKVVPGEHISLLVDYWGGFPGSKTFDILVDDTFLTTENISNLNEGKFITCKYEIPENLLEGKNKVTVTFKSHQGHRAGPIFGVRTIRK